MFLLPRSGLGQTCEDEEDGAGGQARELPPTQHAASSLQGPGSPRCLNGLPEATCYCEGLPCDPWLLLVAFGNLHVVNLVSWHFVYWPWVNTEKFVCVYTRVCNCIYTHNAKHT